MRFISVVLTLGLGAMSLGLTGCKSEKEKLISQARKAARVQDWDEAMKNFQAALKLDAEDYNIQWGIADIYERKGQWKQQEKALNEIMQNAQWKKDYAGVLRPALENNYRKQADFIIGTDVKKAEEFLRKALKINRKNAETNLTLAKILSSRGDRALSGKKYKDAVTAYKSALKLRFSRLMRRKLKGKLDIAQFFAFKESFKPRFEKVKGSMIESGLYVEKEQEFIVSAEAEFAAKCPRRGNPKDPAELEAILKRGRKMALSALTYQMADIVWQMAGKDRPENALVTFPIHHVKILEDGPIAFKKSKIVEEPPKDDGKKKKKKRRRRRSKKPKMACFYPLKVSIPEDAMVEMVQKVDENKFKTIETKTEGEEGKAADGKAAPAKAADGKAAAPAKAAPAAKTAPAKGSDKKAKAAK